MRQILSFSPTTISFSPPTGSSNATHDAAHLTLMNAQTTPQQQVQPQQETAETAMKNKDDQQTEGGG
jgi:hypothetical protein